MRPQHLNDEKNIKYIHRMGNEKCKTDRPDLDGAGFDLHSAIGKLPAPKKGWTLPGHN